MAARTVLAVDIGAESGRVMAVQFDGRQLEIEEIHRFPNTPVYVKGTLYWDFLRILGDIKAGIEKGKPLHPASIGVDTWGVDFGLLDKQGNLIGNPVHYRDKRTANMMPIAFGKVTKEEIFAHTGIQFMPINTIYQLLSLVENHSPQLEIADTFLTIPDLLNYCLTGTKACEFSNATTTQLFNPTTGGWAVEIIEKLDIPSSIFPEVVSPGTQLGSYEDIPVIAPACHDTGSAVAAVPAFKDDFAYVSSGTWSLVGVEVDKPVLTKQALSANITNEGGVYGTYRLLKNVMGLWILQQCRSIWAAAGDTFTYTEMVEMAKEAPPLATIFNPNDPVFLAPDDFPRIILEAALKTSQPAPETYGMVVRSILESLALAYREVLDLVKVVANHSISMLHIVGGGTQNRLLNQMTASATGLPVVSGPKEAAVIGNALVQLIALGDISDLKEARQIVTNMEELRRYEPNEGENSDAINWQEAYDRFKSLQQYQEKFNDN